MSEPFTIKVKHNFSIKINQNSQQQLIQSIKECFESDKGFSVATINLDHLVKLKTSEAFRKAYSAQTFIVADGNPIVWLSLLAGKRVELTPGSELIEPLCKIASDDDIPVAFIGTTEQALESARKNLCDQFPNLKVVKMISPPRNFDPESKEADRYIDAIKLSGAKLCFLALGAPKQEVFAARSAQLANNCGFVSIGAGLDFLAGTQVRAPSWIRKIAMEWFWRMITNPGRLAKRYILCFQILPFMAVQAVRSRFVSQ